MSGKTATERLREMLDECGVEYKIDDRNGFRETIWYGTAAFQLSPTAKMTMIVTPEQAIAATLGGGECEMRQYSNVLGPIDEWQCSECEADVKGLADDTPPNYCPNCGAKVKDVGE